MRKVGYISVKFQKEGIHKYPAAGTDPALADVSFLAFPHRHLFYFQIAIQIFHDDRDIEFIQFKRWLESLFEDATIQLDYKSCEMIADNMYKEISTKYPGRNVIIDISEDNENGTWMQYFVD